ncbi:MAG: hypothetical protein ABGY24_00400 [bacterium]
MARTKKRVVTVDDSPGSVQPMDVDEARGPAPSGVAGDAAHASTQVVDSVTVTLDHPGDLKVDAPSGKVSVYAVDFPGYISAGSSATTSAMRTFGGISGIQDQRQAHPKQLKAKLRPEDPFCHPVIGTSKKLTNTILLRIACEGLNEAHAAKDMGGAKGRRGAGAAPLILEAESSAMLLEEVYTFKQPADLQLDSLTTMRKVSVASQGDARPDVEMGPQAGGAEGAGGPASDNRVVSAGEQKVSCVPAVFLVEGAAEYSVDAYGAGRQSGVPSYLATDNEIVVDYGVANLGRLVKDDGGYYEPSFKENDRSLSPVGHALRKIFLERPVYAGPPLAVMVASKMNNVVFSDADANAQLAKLCYRFSSGPWRGCWVRKGYDPRKDPRAGKYQVVTLLNDGGSDVRSNRKDGNTHDGSSGGRGVGTNRDTGVNDLGWSNADDYDALCSLDASRISQYPARIQMMDIKDEDVLGRLKQGSCEQCQRETGWHTVAEMEKLCDRIATVLGDPSILVQEGESSKIRMLPFSTIRSFGTNAAPILAAAKKRAGAQSARRGGASRDGHGDEDEPQLFDILPSEYTSVIKKLGMRTTPTK